MWRSQWMTLRRILVWQPQGWRPPNGPVWLCRRPVSIQGSLKISLPRAQKPEFHTPRPHSLAYSPQNDRGGRPKSPTDLPAETSAEDILIHKTVAAVWGNNSPANRPSVPLHKVSAWHSKAPHIACKPSAYKPAASGNNRRTSDSSESKGYRLLNPSSPKSNSSSRRQSTGSPPAAPSPPRQSTACRTQSSVAMWSSSALSFGNLP